MGSATARSIDIPSCKPHLGGDTCGLGEVGQAGAQHESCCRTLAVADYLDPAHPGKTVYLDKYEITTGRVRREPLERRFARACIAAIAVCTR